MITTASHKVEADRSHVTQSRVRFYAVWMRSDQSGDRTREPLALINGHYWIRTSDTRHVTTVLSP